VKIDQLLARLVPQPRGGRCFVIGGLCLLVGTFPLGAMDTPLTSYLNRIQEKEAFDRIWEGFRIYDDKHNPVIQQFSIVGRYHGQYWLVDADQGHAAGWENRRFFLGAEAVLFHDFTVQAQIKVSEDFDPFYDGLFQAFVRWSPNETVSLSAGRLDFLYAGLERSLSSRVMPTFERGLLVNQLMPAQVVGLLAKVEVGAFTYRAGVFSGSIDQEFTTFAGGFGAVAGVSYRLPLFYTEGSLHLDYLYNNGNPANNAFKPYDHILSLWHQGQAGPFGLGVDVTAGHGIAGNKSVMSLTVLPTYIFWHDLIRQGDAWEAVLRYQYAVSDGANGLQLQSRYEQKVVPGGLGNNYNAVYAGINYLIYGNRLKLMTGVEYSLMKNSSATGDSYNGWTYFAGVRLYF